MEFDTMLRMIAGVYNLDAGRLQYYADEDAIGGYKTGWPMGSIWEEEGKVLYALVRYIRPKWVLELGTYHGCSATHIAAALHKNDYGHLVAVDNEYEFENLHQSDARIGDLIPVDYCSRIYIVRYDMRTYVQRTHRRFDMIFEDGRHTYEQVYDTWRYLPGLVKPDGWLIAHDTSHFVVGNDIKRGIEDAGINNMTHWLAEPSDCGIGLCRA